MFQTIVMVPDSVCQKWFHLREMHNTLQLPVFLFLFFRKPCPGLWNFGIPDFENLSIWQTKVVSSAFTKVFLKEFI